MPIELTQISAFELETLPREKTVFFFPVGPLEDHGPHLSMGLDLEESARLCFLVAHHMEEEMPGWVGVIMPQAPLGIDSNTTRIAITVRPHVLRDWLVDASRSLMRLRFCHFVCFSGQVGPKQLTAIEEAGLIIRKYGRWRRWGHRWIGLPEPGPTLVSAQSAQIPLREVLKSPFWSDPLEHGGKRDTSIALAIHQNGVRPQYKTLPQVLREPSRWMRNLHRRSKRTSGYWGDPSRAEASFGENELMKTLDDVFPKLRAVWEGSNPNSIFRSWYSILPPNKSFFKAWILVVCILFLMVTWVFLSINLQDASF